MVNFAKASGSQAIQRGLDSAKPKSYVPNIYWTKDEDTRYIQFLTDIDGTFVFDSYKVFLPDTKRPEYLISPQDEAVNGRDGYDPLKDRFGVKPRKFIYALAIELELVTEKVKNPKSGRMVTQTVGVQPVLRKYKDKDGKEHEVPNVGVIIETNYTFGSRLDDRVADGENIEDYVYKIQKKSQGTKDVYFNFEKETTASSFDDLGITEDSIKMLHDYIESLASESRMHTLIDPVPDDYVFDRWNQQKSTDADASSEEPEEEVVEDQSETLAQLRAKFGRQTAKA